MGWPLKDLIEADRYMYKVYVKIVDFVEFYVGGLFDFKNFKLMMFKVIKKIIIQFKFL